MYQNGLHLAAVIRRSRYFTTKMEIKKLNSSVIEKISGDFTIKTLTQCIAEMVLNSLDANSNAVAVLLNPITLKVQIVDNGDGISEESMDLLGERFCTSKYADPNELDSHLQTHGYRGQALANISKRSRSVTILSRKRNSLHTFSKILGKSFGREVRPARERASWGTTVTVEGFFNCLQKRRIATEVVLGDVKQYLKKLLVMYPMVWFTLKNDVTNELVLESHKQNDIVSRFRQLHPDVIDVQFAMIKVSKDSTTVDALMGKELSKYNDLQYFYYNKRPVHSNKLLKFVTDLFLNQKKQQGDKQHPVFAINIKCPLSEVDLLLNSTKTTVQFKHDNLVMRCLEKLICTLFNKKSLAIKARSTSECDVSKIKSPVKINEIDNDSVPSKKRAKVVMNELAKSSEKSLESMLPDDEKRGKGLIMEMFIKSTQVFNREKSDETDFEEESNVCFEKSVTAMKETTSIVVNVKSTRKLKKKRVKLCNAAVQTSFDRKDIEIPDENFTIILDNNKMTFVPKDPKQHQLMAVNPTPGHCKRNGNHKISDPFPFTRLTSSSPNAYPAGMRYSHFQQPYQTDYCRGCNRNCCVQPINPHCLPNLHNLACKHVNLIGRAPGFIPSQPMNLCCEQRNRNMAQQFNPPHAGQVRFMTCCNACNLGCGYDSNIARVPGRLGSTEFMNYYHHLNCGYARNVAKNHLPNLPMQNNYCNLGCRYGNIDDLDYRHRYIYTNQNVPQLDSLGHNNHRNFENIIPRVSNCHAELESNRNNEAVDLLKTNKDLVTTTKGMEQLKSSRRFKFSNFVSAQKDQNDDQFGINFLNIHQNQLITDNNQKEVTELHSNCIDADKDDDIITESTNKCLSTCKSPENLAEFKINILNQSQEAVTDFIHQDQLIACNNQRDVTNFQSNSMGADMDEANITEFTKKCKSHENLAEFNTNASNQSQGTNTDCNPIFIGTNKDQGNSSQFNTTLPSRLQVDNKLLSAINSLEDMDKFTAKDLSGKLLQQHQGNPFQIKTSAGDREKCTLTLGMNQEKEIVLSKEPKLPKDWERRRNEKEKSFYVNTKTGFTLSCTPHLTQNQFKYEERLDLLPKGMSPILKEVEVKEILSQNTKNVLTNYIMDIHKYELPFIKWQKYLDNVDPESFFEVIYMEKVKMFQSFVPKCADINELNDIVKFDKHLFDNFEVIGQVDRKFLAVRSLKENILVLFDQHAVHERIRLEALLKVYKNATSVLRVPFLIQMKPDEVSLLKKYENYLNSLGIYADFCKNIIKITKVPLCLAKKIKTDPNHSLSNLMEYALMEIYESLRLTRGVPASTLPQFIQGVISTEACRGAIKFGDVVSRKECGRLLNELSKCDLPFQCAHGRPTVVPLVRLQSRMVIHKPNLKNLKLH